ncbi:MAG: 30S ribosomal protein S12 methylthiotransferase RimO [Eubacteriales bacterium]|nr:30S ribosomal protein S12 methylthiotransferase RimO [Eubacteriales bacterium]
MATIGVISLGCAKNQVDTERMLGLLTGAGHGLTNDPAEADILIVNTCGFIESAKQESINAILEMAQYKNSGRCKRLVVTGCLSERYRRELAEAMPEIDLLLGVREYETLPRLLGGAADAPHCGPGTSRVLTTPPYRAYLRIADGCDNRCAYCAIPLIRGNLKSEPLEELVDEAKRLAGGGVRELTLIAQDTSGYGRDRYGAPKLLDLLDRLERIDGIHWLRVLYTYPDTVSPELIDRFRAGGKIVPYLDMPLQHTEDEMLRAMRRRGDQAHIRGILEYVETHAPEFMLRTTLMVGFPGETDALFSRMLRFIREHPFDRVGAFAFSAEEGTAAASLPDQVPEEVRQERLQILMEAQREISRARNERRIGQTVEVLVEGTDGARTYGRSYAEAPDVDGKVYLTNAADLPAGTFVPVRLTQAGEYDMFGERLPL